jgi:hypothetical protein
MNEDIVTVEELIDEVQGQSLEEFDSCLDMLRVSYLELLESKTKEAKELHNDAIIELKTLLQDYAGEDNQLVEETFEELFSEMKEDL